ncbi:MAG: lysophospholipid acyltransferase family protein [Paludibacteraceae bacterium]|nr:lysophospholipid acyltransferase family protein [Paludibacteraceae bacterium]
MFLLVRILSKLPLSILYCMADVLLYPLMYYIVRYRRRIVEKNMRYSFPEKSHEELKQLEKRFYHHFADLIAEVIYGYRISDEEMRERMIFDNIELIEELARKNKGVFLMLGHLGNWEWVADIGKRYTDSHITEYNVYRRLKSTSADKTMLALRNKRGGGCIEKNQLLRQLVAMRRSENPITIGFIADQKPSQRSAYAWTTFLHQETPFLNGGEQLARKFGYAVIYLHIDLLKRGYYRARCELITDNPSTMQPDEITKKYAELLEKNIYLQPDQWLWTHNRWRWTK